jgi:hypothetical protein
MKDRGRGYVGVSTPQCHGPASHYLRIAHVAVGQEQEGVHPFGPVSHRIEVAFVDVDTAPVPGALKMAQDAVPRCRHRAIAPALDIRHAALEMVGQAGVRHAVPAMDVVRKRHVRHVVGGDIRIHQQPLRRRGRLRA